MTDANTAENGDARDAPEAAVDPSYEAARQLDEEDARQQLALVSDQLQQANERALRAQAELENFRKRARREMEEERRYASLPLIRDLLPVIDNLDRALQAAEQSEQESGLLEGIHLVRSQLLDVLGRFDCQPVEAVGQPFDPNRHEAVGQEPSDEHAAGIVTRTCRIGYQMHDRVVRPSQVLISSGTPAQSEEDSS